MVATVVKEAVGMLTQMAEPLQEFRLEPGEEYEITVVASNAVGNSSESNPVFFTPPTVPITTATTATKSNFELLYILVPVIAFAIVALLVVALLIAGHRYRSESFLVENKYVVTQPLCTFLSTYSLNYNDQSFHYCSNQFHLSCHLVLAT